MATIEERKLEFAQEFYKWLCAYCIEELMGEEPGLDWPGYRPGSCELCKRKGLVVFATSEQ